MGTTELVDRYFELATHFETAQYLARFSAVQPRTPSAT